MSTGQEAEALRKTWDHINLVMKLLSSAQIELMRRQFTHDRSKLSSPEWEMFESITHKLEGLTYGSEEYEAQRQQMLGQALEHHYFNNRHHPEFFGSEGVLGMNLFDLLEMLCDWIAACQRHADGDIARSIEINRDRFGLSGDLVQILKNTVPWISDEFAPLKTQRDLAAAPSLKGKNPSTEVRGF
jgi:hypothetical protein